jgi:hypothetical protein
MSMKILLGLLATGDCWQLRGDRSRSEEFNRSSSTEAMLSAAISPTLLLFSGVCLLRGTAKLSSSLSELAGCPIGVRLPPFTLIKLAAGELCRCVVLLL